MINKISFLDFLIILDNGLIHLFISLLFLILNIIIILFYWF
jgi:hypothetical protein